MHPVREGTWVLQMIFTQVDINVYPKRSRYGNGETGIYKNRGYNLNLDYELSAWSYLFRLIDIYPYASDIRIAMDLAWTMAHLAQKLKGERNAVKVALVKSGSERRRVLSPIDMKHEAIYLYKYMKCSQLPQMHGHTHLGARYYHKLTLLWDNVKHNVAGKSQIGTPLGIAVEGPFYPFLVDFPGGYQLWGNINPLSAYMYDVCAWEVDARFVGRWYGVKRQFSPGIGPFS